MILGKNLKESVAAVGDGSVALKGDVHYDFVAAFDDAVAVEFVGCAAAVEFVGCAAAVEFVGCAADFL